MVTLSPRVLPALGFHNPDFAAKTHSLQLCCRRINPDFTAKSYVAAKSILKSRGMYRVLFPNPLRPGNAFGMAYPG